ncbi:MAG: bifunctional DNA primase/polymerase [Elusimicrobia bacterium]|nr:bifunctional DNA primase/polymerase [Elusimicrobiota bacterium]
MVADRIRPDDSPALAWARYYLQLGLRPVCLAPRSKVPSKGYAMKSYQTQAPTPEDLASWFADGRANVGLLLGRGVVAVDFDGPGAEQLLVDAGVELPGDAPRSATAHGAHVLLRVPGPVGNRVEMLASAEKRPDGKPVCQVDIRGDGGYIVAPPSTHPSGHVYEWDLRPGRSIPEAPARLLELIASTGGSAGPGAPGTAQAAPGGPQAPNWVTAALRGVRQGLRDVTCTKLAGYFLGKQIPVDIVREQLYAWAGRCTPPFGRDQVDKCVQSVGRKDAAARDAARATAEAHAGDPPEFQVLGYNKGDYFYLPRGSRQVVALRAEQHSKLQLLRLAPLQYWEREFAGRQGVQWDMAANKLLRACEAAGVYDVSRIRGRGAWWDADSGGSILHVGDALVIGDARVLIGAQPPGRYIYEAAPPIPVTVEDPLSDDEAHQLIDICGLINWEHDISASLFAGFCAVAPVCGALAWRPHIWLTGGAGTGKTWVMDKIARRLFGALGLAVQSETTEAGLRQTLGQDALAVTFDEIEGDDERAAQRVQNVLALARQAASETGAVIMKGSPLGDAKTYRVRSCMAFASIGVGVEKYADTTRVSILSMLDKNRVEGAAARFKQLDGLVGDVLTDAYAQRFVARSIRLVPQIRANARTLAAAGAEAIGTQRLGDQIGALLAGCYSLYADDLLTPAQAQEWVGSQAWAEQKQMQDVTDEQRCLQRILEHVVRVQTHKGPADRSVGELVRATMALSNDHVTTGEAEQILWRMGIRVDQHGNDQNVFTISNTHTAIADMLRGTPWARGWARALSRVRGAAPTADKVRFGAVKSRGTEIPLEVLE